MTTTPELGTPAPPESLGCVYCRTILSDDDMDAIFNRPPMVRLAEPIHPHDAIGDVLNEAACFLRELAEDAEFGATDVEEQAMTDAALLLEKIHFKRRPVATFAHFPYRDYGGA
jgi:hypothetical protein